jgi:hypothetical protein
MTSTMLLRTTAGAALAWLLWAPLASGEAPSREQLQQHLLVTRLGWYNPIGQAYGGIWRVDPATWEYRRLRPFLPTTASESGFKGRDGFLTTHGDVLTYRTSPAHFDFDVFSWRMLRRLPTSVEPAEVGWVVQGPTLTAEEAAQLGLAAGTYGVGRCVLQLVTSCGGIVGPRYCEPSPFPGGSSVYGEDAAVLWREEPPLDRATALFGALEDVEWRGHEVPLCLSFDRGRHGLWRCRPQGATLYRLEGGAVGEAAAVVDLTAPPV